MYGWLVGLWNYRQLDPCFLSGLAESPHGAHMEEFGDSLHLFQSTKDNIFSDLSTVQNEGMKTTIVYFTVVSIAGVFVGATVWTGQTLKRRFQPVYPRN